MIHTMLVNYFSEKVWFIEFLPYQFHQCYRYGLLGMETQRNSHIKARFVDTLTIRQMVNWGHLS